MDIKKTIEGAKAVAVEKITAKVIQGTIVGETMRKTKKTTRRILWTGWQYQ